MTKARTIANLGTGFVNISDSGTEGTKVASGTTGQRGSTTGQLRYNTTTNTFEFRDNSSTTDFLSAPQISSVDVVDVQTDAGGNETFVITGKNFKVGAVVTFIAADASVVNATSTARNSATQLTVVVPRGSFSNAKEPYDIKLVNGDALQASLENQINVDNNPVWQTGATLPTIYHNLSQSIQLSATDSDGDTVTYAVHSGSLPTNLSMNSSGLITGTLGTYGSATTYTFTIRATANSKTADRQFTQLVEPNSAPTWNTAAGSLGILYDSGRAASGLTALSASDAQGQTITYAVTSSSIPGGLTLNSNGTWSGTANAVGSNTVSTFEVTPTDSAGLAGAARQFTIEIKAPVLTVLNTVGSGTWSAPITGNVKVLVIGGGGGDGCSQQGSAPAAAGGIVYHASYAVTSGTSYNYTVGFNGHKWQQDNSQNNNGYNGGDSKFGISGNSAELIALGGGGGRGCGSGQQSAGAANEGGYGNTSAVGCTKGGNASLGTQQGVGATIYGGYRSGTSNMQHYAWDYAGSAGAGGNGDSCSRCGGTNGSGGAGVDFSSINSLMAAQSNDNGFFAGGKSRGGGYGAPSGSNGSGANSYGGHDGTGNVAGVVMINY